MKVSSCPIYLHFAEAKPPLEMVCVQVLGFSQFDRE